MTVHSLQFSVSSPQSSSDNFIQWKYKFFDLNIENY